MDYKDFLEMRGKCRSGSYSELDDDNAKRSSKKGGFLRRPPGKSSSFTGKAPGRSSSFDANLLRPSKRESALAKMRNSQRRRSSVKSSLLRMIGGEDAVGLLDVLEGSEGSEDF